MIQIRFDRQRGCGWRKPGGLYLVSEGLAKECFRLPVPLTVCPTCHGGIKFTRGYTWIDADALIGKESCQPQDPEYCAQCPFAQSIGRAGLLWVGEKFYKTPADFTRETMSQGDAPSSFAAPGPGGVIIAGHTKDCPKCKGEGSVYTPGIFHAFKPTAIEYVVKGDESLDELAAMEKRGITPVQIQRDAETLFDD